MEIGRKCDAIFNFELICCISVEGSGSCNEGDILKNRINKGKIIILVELNRK